MNLFSDPSGWEARLRQQSLVTRSARGRGEDIVVSSALAVIDARFQLGILDKLSEPKFLAVERQTEGGLTYLIYESVVPKPTHYQELGMNVATPTVIRREMLQTIDSSWGRSDESWIDIVAVPMYHRLDLDKNGQPSFSKTKLNPLAGAPVHLFSEELVNEFLNVKDGTEIGDIIGANQPLRVNMGNLIRYHSGSFGATGAGKSNFTSQLIRKALESEDLRIVIFDIAGEYFVHLADIFKQTGTVYSTETFEDAKQFLESQVVPETLEERLTGQPLVSIAEKLLKEGRVKRIAAGTETEITLGTVTEMLAGIGNRAGALQAKMLNQRINSLIADSHLKPENALTTLPEQPLKKLKAMISEGAENAPERSSLKGDLSTLRSYLEEKHEDREKPVSGPQLASLALDSPKGDVMLVYSPEPYDARRIVSQFITALLKLKKTAGKAAVKLLIVLDEAQEYIPDRNKQDDYTEQSNIAVEALLRQGRKYRAHCWLGTQRVAHLNVSALQQLHSYFVNVLPRIWDRLTIADAYSVSLDLLDKTLDLEAGEWLFVSYNASKRRNVPVFVRTPNNENNLVKALEVRQVAGVANSSQS
jgi:hypothetical protein